MPEEDVTITIEVKEQEESPVANQQLNINLDAVKVQTRSAYVELDDTVIEGDGELEGAILEKVDDKKLKLTLESGNEIVLDTEKIIATFIKAADLPVTPV